VVFPAPILPSMAIKRCGNGVVDIARQIRKLSANLQAELLLKDQLIA
jgi:hypothetical protein